MIENAFRILVMDPKVKAIFINIFGGILRCDILANGVVAAAKKLKLKIPVIIRMEGTNMEEGHRILNESGLNFTIGMLDDVHGQWRRLGDGDHGHHQAYRR